MDQTTLLAVLLITIAIILVTIYAFDTPAPPPQNIIQSSTVDGTRQIESNQVLPLSYDQSQGATFSFTCWVRVDDFAYKYGQQKVIFTKGSGTSACPALLLDGTSNSLLVKIDTFGSTETIPIGNIPAKKWMHIGMAVDQDSVDVYVNGMLHTHHTLGQLPRQNGSTVTISPNGGFDGKLALLEYYSYYMTADQMKASMATAPKPTKEENVYPPYFDITWWTKAKV